jgi:NADH-quinone oxidoreductase subunit C
MSELVLTGLPEGLVTNTVVFRDEVTLITTPDQLIALLTHLKGEQKFEMLVDVTCIDYLPKEPRFGVLYQLNSLSRNIRVRVKTLLSEFDPHVPSACPVYMNADWLEREVYDLFGIIFDGHPDLRRILLPLGYEGHPLRRDVPYTVEEVAFSFNRERIDAEKPRPSE